MKIQLKILNKEFYQDIIGVDFGKKEARIEYKNLPTYATPGSAAMDLYCTEDVTLYPGETKMIPTGIAIWIGSDRYKKCNNPYTVSDWSITGLILPRSGLGTKGLILANTIGVIDQDYQGELKISAWNRNSNTVHTYFSGMKYNRDEDIEIKAGDRIAQLMFVPVIKVGWQIIEEFSNTTERGEGGFSSTGV